MNASELQSELGKYASDNDAAILQRFFKTGKGEYGEGDLFLGIKVPVTRKVCRDYKDLPLTEIEKLLESPIHEHRLAALVIMVMQFKSKASNKDYKKSIYELYLKRKDRINNWDLVDVSCRDIVGGWLKDKSREPLYNLAVSKDLWERRVAIVTTLEFIRSYDFVDVLAISEILIDDKEDLIHKASGWMLREAGKRDVGVLLDFLDKHAVNMPRTMLRYSIEKLSTDQKKYYMTRKVQV